MHVRKHENRILLVDDDVKNLQVAMSILKDYNVIYAQSGQKALELLEEQFFDLILLDVVMPGLNGYEVCSQIKQNNKISSIPVIFLTVKDDEKDIVKGFEKGAVDYIVKPFFSDVLLKRVELHLKLASTVKDLKVVNSNLNELVNKQVEDIRQKEQVLFQQSKISAMSDMIDVISLQWNKPLSLIKLYMQSLDFKLQDDEGKEILNKSLQQLGKLDGTLHDFQKFFKNSMKKESVNLKVLIDNVLILLKEDLIKQNITLNTEGCNLIDLKISYDEIKHIFLKLISYTISRFESLAIKEKQITLELQSDSSSIYINYKDNSSLIEHYKLKELFSLNNRINNNFDLGFYLIKVFIEKNAGSLTYNDCSEGINIQIRFDK